jgi:hypothetical protein
VKYSAEAQEIKKVLGKPVAVHIVAAVLDEKNWDEIVAIMKQINPEITVSMLIPFFSAANLEKQAINRLQITSERYVDLPDIFDLNRKTYSRPNLPRTVMMSSHMLTKLVSGAKNLLARFPIIMNKAGRRKISLNFDVEMLSLYEGFAERNKPAFTPAEMYKGLTGNALDFIMTNIVLYKSGSRIGWSENKGSVPVTVTQPDSIFDKYLPAPYRPDVPVFSGTKIDDPDYEILNIEGYVPVGEQTKVLFPSNYLSILSQSSFSKILNSKSKKMLGNCFIGEDDIDECMDLFDNAMNECNKRTSMITSPKPTFLLPAASIIRSNTEPLSSTCGWALQYLSGYTKNIVEKAHNGIFSSNFDKNQMTAEITLLRNIYNEKNSTCFQKNHSGSW